MDGCPFASLGCVTTAGLTSRIPKGAAARLDLLHLCEDCCSIAEFLRTRPPSPRREGVREKVIQGGFHAKRYLHNRSGYTGFLADWFHGHGPAGRLHSASHS